MRISGYLGVLVLSVSLSTAHAAPADYTFTVSNVTQRALDVSDAENIIELPLDEPAYPGAITITGSFTYDPEITGIITPPPPEEITVAEVLYVNAITNLTATVNGETYSRDTSFVVFIDETTTGQGAEYAGDTLQSMSVFGTILETFGFTHNGIDYTARTPGFVLSEGVDDGFNFFPDAALADTACGYCSSSAALPARLPPNGATHNSFYFTFVNDEAGVITRNYQLRGDIEISPVSPIPKSLPAARDYSITIDVTGHQFYDNEGNSLALPNSPITSGDVVTGGFFYDPKVGPAPAYSSFLCGDALCIANHTQSGLAANFFLVIADQTYINQTGIALILADETAYQSLLNVPYPSLDFPEPQDFLSFENPPFSALTPNIAIPHDGLLYQLWGFQLNYFEGDSGHDFFPDTDPEPGFPARLPPDGAEFGAAILWLRAEIEPGVYRKLTIYGDLTIEGAPLPVQIDIDPWSAGNQVFPNSDNPIGVGIIASSTANGETVDLDTTKIDPNTLRLGMGAVTNVQWPWYQDFNNDYNVDAAYAFKTQDVGVLCEDTELTLTGETYDGTPFEGTGTIDATDCVTGFCHPL